jgi:hypothetical protein
MNKIILLSFPRSGNTWVRYIFEFLSQKPTQGYLNNPKDIPPYIKTDIGVDPNAKPIMRKSHQELWDDCNSMIFLLRDYKEAILRDAKHFGIQDPNELLGHFQSVTRGKLENPWQYDYIFALQQFDKFQSKKILVYYEDLILEPQQTIKKMVDFSEISSHRLDEFFEKYQDHQNQSISNYEPGSHSKGISALHHSDQLPKHVQFRLTEHIMVTQPILFGKYLRRYIS